MKYILFCILQLVLLGTFTLATSRAQAQTTAPGPYYATPSWDQTIACTTTTNCPRFIVLSNMNSEAVLDRETGLVWDRSASSFAASWASALGECVYSTRGNRRGWRLPTVQELASVGEHNATELSLPTGHPFQNVQSGRYWSSNSSVDNAAAAWFVSLGFVEGPVTDKLDKGVLNFFWCVRGGQGIDPQ